MKITFSALLCALSAVAFGAPVSGSSSDSLVKRDATVLYSTSADYILRVYEGSPKLPAQIGYGAEISRTGGKYEIDNYVSFYLPDHRGLPAAVTDASKCRIVIKDPLYSTESQRTQVFTVPAERAFSTVSTFDWDSKPSGDKHVATLYVPETGVSVAEEFGVFDCKFAAYNQFVFRPVGDDDHIAWYQSGVQGAFLEVLE